MYRPLLSLACVLMTACANPGLTSRCDQPRPPADAAVTANHGEYFFLHPRQIDAAFSGCQSMWRETGSQLFSIAFAHGRAVAFRQYASADSPDALECRYGERGESLTADAQCPAHEDIKSGFRTLARSDELNVPATRDPRIHR